MQMLTLKGRSVKDVNGAIHAPTPITRLIESLICQSLRVDQESGEKKTRRHPEQRLGSTAKNCIGKVPSTTGTKPSGIGSTSRNLCFTNKMRKAINTDCMRKFIIHQANNLARKARKYKKDMTDKNAHTHNSNLTNKLITTHM